MIKVVSPLILFKNGVGGITGLSLVVLQFPPVTALVQYLADRKKWLAEVTKLLRKKFSHVGLNSKDSHSSAL